MANGVWKMVHEPYAISPQPLAMTRFVVFLGALALAASGCVARQADLRPTPGQNVLLITIDTLRADALGSYGGPAATPALDRLAGEGVRFDFAHAHAVVTLTSHASILTGTYPFQHGIRDNSGYRLPAGARTAGTLLKQAGYATAAFVGAFPVHSRFGLNQGFDLYDDRFGDTRAPDEFAMPERAASAVVPLARQWIADHGARGSSRSGRGGWVGRSAVVRVGAPVRPARTVSPAGSVRRAVCRPTVLRRSRGDRRGSRAAARRCARSESPDAHHRDRRPWRRAWRSRRAVPRPVRL
ncbi:MAG: hypothetical protein DMF96_01345 [Acidobacteria bacterium]|nr:MAG: hypothetical protein DMF96_01345 [Acidobacteriota bacterium]